MHKSISSALTKKAESWVYSQTVTTKTNGPEIGNLRNYDYAINTYTEVLIKKWNKTQLELM